MYKCEALEKGNEIFLSCSHIKLWDAQSVRDSQRRRHQQLLSKREAPFGPPPADGQASRQVTLASQAARFHSP